MLPLETGFRTDTQPSSEDLLEVAGRFDTWVDNDRANELDAEGRLLWNATIRKEAQESHWVFGAVEFQQSGLHIGIALHTILETDQDVVAHFTPFYEGRKIRERAIWNATASILTALTGLQDYCLLAEAGYIRRPRTIYGSTNSSMAYASKRIGFTTIERDDWVDVRGDYETVRDAVFSADSQATVDLLLRRVGRQLV